LTSPTTTSPDADVIVVGAGLAGTTAATLLARQGRRVILMDRWLRYPDCFKAEKLEPDQIALLRKFGLMDALLPRTGRVREIWEAQDGKVVGIEQREQFGIFYQDMVNGVRATFPPTLEFKIGRVHDIAPGQEIQRVTLAEGDAYTARLVVIACGVSGDLLARLGMRKQMIKKDQSLAFGFTIAQANGLPFPFNAVTYYPDGCAGQVAYLTLFPIGGVMRANLFLCWSANGEGTRTFVQEPRRELMRLLPKLTRVIGEFEVVSRVESFRIDLWRMEEYLRPGVVLLADAFQSVCPTTGSGVSKVLTDVDVLVHDCVPQWLSTPGMGTEKMARFYDNDRKREVDRHSLADASSNRQMAINEGLIWRARRVKRRWNAGRRLVDYFRLTRKLTA
jgi:2-polyprenyl-6-methoxyphenol hydroxylase-like FAD-dependent oxidoreductase